MSILFLVAIALLPAIVLCVYVFKKDRVEKEPKRLLLKLFLFGAVSCIPIALIEVIIDPVINMFFSEETVSIAASDAPASAMPVYIYNFVMAFIGVALVEEFGKLFILERITRKNKEFNCIFDGLIYSVFVSLGFAALENVLYVLGGGIGVGISRAFLAVPGHMFDAVIMGYYYSMWHITDKAAQEEKELIEHGYIAASLPAFSSTKNKVMCLLMPVVSHGLYDFCLFSGATWTIILFLVFVVFLYVRCFSTIKKMSLSDGYEAGYVRSMIMKKYPDFV